MMRLKMFRRLIVASCLMLLFMTVAVAQDYDIMPGSRIGKIEIGMSRQAVHNTLGKPTGTYALRDRGYKGEYWFSSDNSNTLRVFYDPAGRVYQVSITSSRFKTPEGLTTQSSLDEIKRHYKNLKVLHFAARGNIDYYDAVRQGISFEFTERVDDRNVSSYEMYGLLIHKRGGSVLPEPDELFR
jgi:hypothetical protein